MYTGIEKSTVSVFSVVVSYVMEAVSTAEYENSADTEAAGQFLETLAIALFEIVVSDDLPSTTVTFFSKVPAEPPVQLNKVDYLTLMLVTVARGASTTALKTLLMSWGSSEVL